MGMLGPSCELTSKGRTLRYWMRMEPPGEAFSKAEMHPHLFSMTRKLNVPTSCHEFLRRAAKSSRSERVASVFLTVGFSHARYLKGNRTSSIWMGDAATVALSKAKLL